MSEVCQSPQKSQIILVGPMGAGKSTIGRMLAKALKFDFFDSDNEVVNRSGADIPWIFDMEGEEGFRLREANMIELLTQKNHVVIATGGGAVLREENRHNLTQKGVIVYLKTSVERQFLRTCRDKNRPLLQNGNSKQILIDLFAQRDPVYMNLSDILVVTDKMNPKSVVRYIIQQLPSKGLVIKK